MGFGVRVIAQVSNPGGDSPDMCVSPGTGEYTDVTCSVTLVIGCDVACDTVRPDEA